MPEEAPVMRTTFPATFSRKNEEKMEIISLINRNGGNKKHIAAKVKGNAVKLRKVLTISILQLRKTAYKTEKRRNK